MKVTLKKKTIKIIIAIILIIVAIIVGIMITNSIVNDKNIKETEEKLSQIDAKELEAKLIEELEKTELNVNIELSNGVVLTKFTETKQFEGYISAQILGLNQNNYGAVIIPCFKIESDSNGKFKNIEYINLNYSSIRETIRKIIQKTFKESYDIELFKMNDKYSERFNKGYKSKGNIFIDDKDFGIAIMNKINTTNFDEVFTSYTTSTFGL